MIGLLLSLLSNWRLMAALGGIIVLLGSNGWSYFKGYQAAEKQCQTEALQEQIQALQDDIERTQSAYERAALRAIERDVHVQSLNEKVEAYEIDLADQPSCVLSNDDAKRLRSIQ